MRRKIFLSLFIILCLILAGCGVSQTPAQIAATTLPVYEFTSLLCAGSDLTVTRLVTESVSCLHDYSLNVSQVRAAEAAELIVINGAGLEAFMEDILHDKNVIDSSLGIELIECDEEDDHNHDHGHDHHHETDSHIWLSPENAALMARNIHDGLCAQYPQYTSLFDANLASLESEITALETYGNDQLADLKCRQLITFHDGFSYLAESFELQILDAMEEESGSEASAAELKHLINQVREHNLPAIFTEVNGSVSAASVISRETGISAYGLDMAMAGDSWFEAMYYNINTLKEALQ